jgi:4-hydroxy-3-polyprenylbenzoate decarboxylase
MAYKDLREYLECLRSNGELMEIDRKVDPFLEIAEIAGRVVKNDGPALLFKRVRGYSIPVLINAFGSFRRMSLALQTPSVQAAADDLDTFINSEVPETTLAKIKSLPKLKRLAKVAPKHVQNAPCKEVILKGEDVSLDRFPIIHCWPKDAGKYITLPVVFTRDPDTGVRNAGCYRMQVFDGRSAAMHWHIHKHGAFHYKKSEAENKPLEVAVVIGADPVVTYAASTPLPEGIDEMLMAGFLRKKPVPMVPCETLDLDVPASAEIVLEGVVHPAERREEGPFGDHTGHYSTAEPYPVFHVQCITHRKDPIYQTTVTGKPPMEDWYMGQTSVKLFKPLLKKAIPELVDMCLPKEGLFHNMAIISIDKQYPHQGPSDCLDHAARRRNFCSKMGIDATIKIAEEDYPWQWPEPIESSPDIAKLVDERWKEYGF